MSSPTAVRTVPEHVVEIVSDAGEGAQKCGQIFAAVSARMGNGVWTVEIIPAEIQPPPRSPAGASGNRIRLGSGPVTNWGDEAHLVVAFNEQVLLHRHRQGALAEDAILLLEDMWATDPTPDVAAAWSDALEELATRRYTVIRVPMQEQCLALSENPRKGKNMFALGLLAAVYRRDLELLGRQIAHEFRKKTPETIAQNVALPLHGHSWGARPR